MELHRGAVGTPTKYVLRVESIQHQIGRTPTIITIPGKTDGTPQVVGYDLGVVNETITLNGIVGTADESVVSGDPAYEAGVTKVYPSKPNLRVAALYWWVDAIWSTNPPTQLIGLHDPLEAYDGIIQSCQFTLEPAHDYYHFSLVFRIAKY